MDTQIDILVATFQVYKFTTELYQHQKFYKIITQQNADMDCEKWFITFMQNNKLVSPF
jgi:hypothetical protein